MKFGAEIDGNLGDSYRFLMMTAVSRVAGSNLERNKYLYGLQLVVPDLWVCDYSMFVNATTIQESCLVWRIFFMSVFTNIINIKW